MTAQPRPLYSSTRAPALDEPLVLVDEADEEELVPVVVELEVVEVEVVLLVPSTASQSSETTDLVAI